MAACIDRNDQTSLNALALSKGPYTNSRGEYTLQQIDLFAEDLLNNIQQDSEKNPIIIASNKYGSDLFYQSYNGLVFFLGQRDDLNLYPDLQSRLSAGEITALEFADFLTQYNYTPTGVINKRNTNALNLLFELNSYYKSSFSTSILGGFCNLMPQIFGAVEAFFTIIGQIEGLINDAISFLNKIRNLGDAIVSALEKETIKQLINTIKDKIVEVVVNTFLAIKSAIENFNIEQFVEDVETFVVEKVFKRAQELKEDILNFFTEENQKKIEQKFKALIDYAIGILENPSLDEIRFLVARFCSFALNVEALIRDIKRPIDDYGFKYQTVIRRLQAISNSTTASAVQYGAIRYTPEVKKEAINKMEEAWRGEAPSTESNTSTAKPKYTPTGESQLNPPPPKAEEYTDLPLWEKVKSGNDPRFTFSGNWVNELGAQGWSKVDQQVKICLVRLQKQLGVRIRITSAWRSVQYNKKIGGAKLSRHLSGLAVDIAKRELANKGITEEMLIKAAYKSGFRFVEVGKTYYHLDIREKPRQAT